MWDTIDVLPREDGEIVLPPAPLGSCVSGVEGLNFGGTFTRTLTEWDSHYVPFIYNGMSLVAELNIDGMPYVEVQHNSPCRGISINERLAKTAWTCAQTNRAEAMDVGRRFSIDSPVEPVILWDTYMRTDEATAILNFGRAILGEGLPEDEYREATRVVTEGLHRLVMAPNAPWWPVWHARRY